MISIYHVYKNIFYDNNFEIVYSQSSVKEGEDKKILFY